MATKQPDKNPQADLQEVVAPIRDANNVLVTINSNPTVDQMASCIGLTLVLNKIGKHATAVFSGKVPSTLEFLKPEETFEKNTDSLRDFIISLDKSKADKLRYKVEDDVVKIFITPYKASISEEDLGFSQGDFNVDVVIALGVEEKKDLDEAILAHGRILHDATVISINTQSGSSHLGSINWSSKEASSLCEMVADIVQSLSGDVLDKQNATALLTGIVAETDRYSNDKATPHTMSIAGALMSAGASTQLVSNELDSVLKSQGLPPVAGGGGGDVEEAEGGNTGELDIDHTADEDEKAAEEETGDQPPEVDTQEQIAEKQTEEGAAKDGDEYLEHLNLTENPHLDSTDSDEDQAQTDEPDMEESPLTAGRTTNRLVKDPPHFTGQLTANTVPEDRQYTGSTDPLSNIPESKILGADKQRQNEEIKRKAAARASSLQQKVDQTLREIEESVSSPHLSQEEDMPLSIEEARKAAEAAAGEESRPEAREDMGSSQLGSDINNNDSSSNPPPPTPPPITPL